MVALDPYLGMATGRPTKPLNVTAGEKLKLQARKTSPAGAMACRGPLRSSIIAPTDTPRHSGDGLDELRAPGSRSATGFVPADGVSCDLAPRLCPRCSIMRGQLFPASGGNAATARLTDCTKKPDGFDTPFSAIRLKP